MFNNTVKVLRATLLRNVASVTPSLYVHTQSKGLYKIYLPRHARKVFP
jgi:hypothetical protein